MRKILLRDNNQTKLGVNSSTLFTIVARYTVQLTSNTYWQHFRCSMTQERLKRGTRFDAFIGSFRGHKSLSSMGLLKPVVTNLQER